MQTCRDKKTVWTEGTVRWTYSKRVLKEIEDDIISHATDAAGLYGVLIKFKGHGEGHADGTTGGHYQMLFSRQLWVTGGWSNGWY